jgi:hypothetical protein
MKKYFLALLVSVAHASSDDIDITPLVAKYAAANPVQPLPNVIEPMHYDILESKRSNANLYATAGKCTEPAAIMEVCKSPLQLKYEKFQTKLKAKAAAKRKLILEKGKK